MVFCGDCGGPTYIEGQFRKCDRCSISTRQKRDRAQDRERIAADKLMAEKYLQDRIEQAQEMLDEMQINQFGDSIPT